MAIERSFIRDLALAAGVSVSDAKKFLMKLAVKSAHKFAAEKLGLKHVGIAWIPVLKLCLPVFWYIVENVIPKEKLVEWLKEFKAKGEIPEEAYKEILAAYEKLPEIYPKLEPAKRREEVALAAKYLELLLKAMGKTVPPFIAEIAKGVTLTE